MDPVSSKSEHEQLMEARERIAKQTQEITQLQQHLAAEQLAQELQRLLSDAVAINAIFSPMTHSRVLEMVVQTSAQVTSRCGDLCPT